MGAQVNADGHDDANVRFILDIEGAHKPWNEDQITVEQIAQLGGWDPGVGVLLIDSENNERTLKPGECIELKHGMAFSKKVRFRRG
jgi:hypothetical protein